jgi:hypothetical protein
MKKITAATIKSFIRKNEANAFLRVKSKFDGMIAGIVEVRKMKKSFTEIKPLLIVVDKKEW